MYSIDFNTDPVLDAIDARLEMGAQQPLIASLPASSAGTGREMMDMLAAMIARHHEPSVPPSVPPPQTDDGSTAAAVTAGLGTIAASVAAIGSAAGSRGSSAANPPPSEPAASTSETSSSSGSSGAASTGTDETGAAVDRALASYDAAHPERVPTADEVRSLEGTRVVRLDPVYITADTGASESES